LAVVCFLPTRLSSPVYNATYVDALAAHNDTLVRTSDSFDYVDLNQTDAPEDSEEL